MATYKTPDVYVEEISVFPPSVAEVETAIPAFIGYTGKATKLTDNDLHMMPTRIKSMLEFEQYYGYGPAPVIDAIYVDDIGNFKKAEITNTYFMYDSIRLFFDNGGGDCYICSVGLYEIAPPAVDSTAMTNGLLVVANYDEPTILLFPDAVSMAANELGALQVAALKQCNELMDRVAIFDLQVDDPNGDSFRNFIGMNFLKYGMAYTPWLNVSLNKNISYNDISSKIFRSGTSTLVSLKKLTSNDDIKAVITNYDKLTADQGTIATAVGNLLDDDNTYRQQVLDLFFAYEEDKGQDTMKDILEFFYKTAKTFTGWANGLTNDSIKEGVNNKINNPLRSKFKSLVAWDKALGDDDNGFDSYTPNNGGVAFIDLTNVNWNETEADNDTNIFKNTAVIPADPALLAALTTITDDDDIEPDDKDAARADALYTLLKAWYEDINDEWLSVLSTVASIEKNYEDNLIDSFPLYKSILKSVNDSATVMPPSGAMAGIFAATDRDRGVWKAPANVSVANVLGPNVTFAASELEKLNIDANAGKSINAIRAFAGKGTLVWGARTLAGNDNEWRYVPVRRFYVNVEESIKKSTYWAVFEPNNANTWIRVKGMIESYLTNKWKEGALVGAKPDEAFFVRIGIGSTMTPDDVLNGYMKVEIGMAVVRPAEFIVLKFSHKLQQA